MARCGIYIVHGSCKRNIVGGCTMYLPIMKTYTNKQVKKVVKKSFRVKKERKKEILEKKNWSKK